MLVPSSVALVTIVASCLTTSSKALVPSSKVALVTNVAYRLGS